METKSTRLDEVENELSRERKTSEDLKSQADQKKLDSVRTSERIADLERQVEAKMGELEAVNREKSEHEAVVSVLENQVGGLCDLWIGAEVGWRIKFFAFVSAMRILGQWIGTVGNLFSS